MTDLDHAIHELLLKVEQHDATASNIEEVRSGLAPEDTEGEKKLYVISGPGINMNLVAAGVHRFAPAAGGCKTWVVRASSEREAWFMVFSLRTEFFKDIMAAWPERHRVIAELAGRGLANELTLAEDVLGFEDSSCWSIGEAIGNCVIEAVYTKSASKR